MQAVLAERYVVHRVGGKTDKKMNPAGARVSTLCLHALGLTEDIAKGGLIPRV